MKCLSIQQPWGQYIAAGLKDVENRPWGLKTFPQRVLIHVGKKPAIKDYDEMPMYFRLIIENAEDLGLVPLLEEMPLGAIIGMVDIVGCTANDPESSIWAGMSDDPEHPIYNLHLANARLFKEPIMGVKGKLGIFEYPDITEDNLPETVDTPDIRREGKELFIPLHPEEIEDFRDMDDEGLSFGLNLINGNEDLFVEIVDDEVLPLPTDFITFFAGSKSLRVKVIESEFAPILDDDGNVERFPDPDGEMYTWTKIFYDVVPEKSRRRRKSLKGAPKSQTQPEAEPVPESKTEPKPEAEPAPESKAEPKPEPAPEPKAMDDPKTLADALAKLPESCRNIIEALQSMDCPYEYHKDPDSDYAEIYTCLTDDDGKIIYNAQYLVHLDSELIVVTAKPVENLPKRAVKKAIEKVNEINASAAPAWLVVDVESGAVLSHVSYIASDQPITSKQVLGMIAYACYALEQYLPELK